LGCYHFIEQARTFDLVENPARPYEAAQAFAGFNASFWTAWKGA